ncbi:hypothetical protein [Aureimonas psammosilenae]|uniref:hypothetical protein n=1 Tax=Aureimonas psammosilenae TaxID=2495496 RepID=UPI00126063AD|nr:hypothetical protein [Aureimonas psammosilenae]
MTEFPAEDEDAVLAMEELRNMLGAFSRVGNHSGEHVSDVLRNAVASVENGFHECDEAALMAAKNALAVIKRNPAIFDEDDVAKAREMVSIVGWYRKTLMMAKHFPTRRDEEEDC